jgi:acetoin utilization deacetylase AcuC-like enzyme
VTATTFLDEHARHAQPGHPERPARLEAVRAAVEADPLLAGLPRLDAPPARRSALERIHFPEYLDLVEAFCEQGGGDLDIDTYATPASFDVARQSVGNLLALVDAVMTGEAGNAFAIARPPGHHARPAQAMGFCLLANAALAARHAQMAHGADRVLIVDLDVHHGNGTQECFYDDPSVLVVSAHQDTIYPGTGRLGETGAEAGEGFTVNLPIPAGAGDEVAGLYRGVLPPLAARFRPDLVVLSFGADPHRLDPLAGLNLSVAGLAEAAGVVQEIAEAEAGGRLVVTLEGGYLPDVLAASVAAVLRRLTDPTAAIDDPFGPTSRPPVDLAPLAAAVRQLHRLGA